MPGRLLVGEVLHSTKMGYLVAGISDPNMRIRLGAPVEDDSGRRIGRIVDVIGRVESPYAVIRLEGEPPEPGARIYMRLRRKPRGARAGRSVKKRGGKRGRLQAGVHHRNPRGPKGVRGYRGGHSRRKPRR
ncbi:MAG: Gar1/Naf1 family protein [Desulfurococcales archaeon]|nr:Gar1/Naf1 family protein [Desulfurococcales archaeon]